MGHGRCCVVGCKNSESTPGIKFYNFPRAQHKLIQREKWIAALNRVK